MLVARAPLPRCKTCLDARVTTWAVACAESKSKEAVAREFKVDPKRICKWCSMKEKLTELKKNGKTRPKRLNGGG